MNSLTNRFKKLKNRKGFTLVELIVVIVIIGILAAILIPRLTGFVDKADNTEALVLAKEVATAYDSLAAEHGGNYSHSAITETAVLNLAGVSEGGDTHVAVTLDSDGGVHVTTDNGGAGRGTSADPVKTT